MLENEVMSDKISRVSDPDLEDFIVMVRDINHLWHDNIQEVFQVNDLHLIFIIPESCVEVGKVLTFDHDKGVQISVVLRYL